MVRTPGGRGVGRSSSRGGGLQDQPHPPPAGGGREEACGAPLHPLAVELGGSRRDASPSSGSRGREAEVGDLFLEVEQGQGLPA